MHRGPRRFAAAGDRRSGPAGPRDPRDPHGLDADLEADLERFLAEDVGDGDVTTEALGLEGRPASAEVVARQACVVAGIDETCRLLARVGCEAEGLVLDGEEAEPGDVVLRARGPADGLLTAERLLLNVLGRMSGIATTTRRTLERARSANPDIVVAATRKTTPGFRRYEKRAVVLGGGDPHREGLFDAILIKENHLAFLGPAKAVQAAKRTGLRVEVEAETLAEAVQAADAGADRVLLDNFAPDDLSATARELRDRFPGLVLEASGGITPEDVDMFATDVDIVSLGSLTTRAAWVDLSMRVRPLAGGDDG